MRRVTRVLHRPVRSTHSPRAIAIAAAAVIAAAAARPASASPLEDPSIGGAPFTGPTQPGPESIYVNPAAMALGIDGQHFSLRTSLRVDQIHVDRQYVDPSTGATSPGPSVSATPLSPGGGITYYYVGPRISGGVSLFAPFAESFVSGQPALGYQSLGGHHYQAFIAGGGSFRISGNFAFGASLELAYSSLSLSYLRDTALEAGSSSTRGINSDCGGSPCGFENPAAAERDDINVSTGGLGNLFATKNLALSVGAMYRPGKAWWFAVSFLQPPGAFGDLDLPGAATVTTAPRDGSAKITGNAEITYRLPQTVYVGARGPLLGDYDLEAAFRWQNYSRQQKFDVRLFGDALEAAGVPAWDPRYRGFQDVFSLQAGLEQRAHTRLRLGGRIRFETGAVTSQALSPLQVAGPNVTAAVGAKFRFAAHVVLSASYALTWFPTLSSDPSLFDPIARLHCVDSGYALDQCRAAAAGRAIPTADGTYSRFSHSLSLSIRYDSL